MQDTEHFVRKGNPIALFAEGNYGLGRKTAAGRAVDMICGHRDRESSGS
jgi:tRNA A37 threonylcarbamoyladenosine synthetase subunit TsaC/SUA5/YrdC